MDNKYARGKIYKITSEQTDNVYIGSTIQKLNCRLNQHKCDIKLGRSNSSKEIVKYDDAKITLIENYPCNTKKELLTRERYYIEQTLNIINKFIPTRTDEEYRKDNREKIKLNDKQYRANNKEKEQLRKKKYKEDNREKLKLSDKQYRETNKDKITATRHYRNSWGGDCRCHNNLLRIDPKLFEK